MPTYGGKRRIMRGVVDLDHAETQVGGDHHLLCCWDTCDQRGFENIKAVERNGPYQNIHFVFCSERHKWYWLNSVRDLGNLPPGFKLSLI
jgi:hypothetical protein